MENGKICRELGRGALAALAGLGIAAGAWGQSFNIDINSEFGTPQEGGGPPSSAFGAAANQSGFWNAVPAQGPGNFALRNLSGQLSGVMLIGPAGGSGGGNNFPGNTGDFAFLLNDFRSINPSNTFTFTGLANGLYELYSYAVYPSQTSLTTTLVTVGGVTHAVTGPMPGNEFILGITHSIHTVSVTSGTLAVTLDMSGPNNGILNGFQLVVVPEPGTMLGLTSAFLFLIRKRRKRT
jgi:hypothetical protein